MCIDQVNKILRVEILERLFQNLACNYSSSSASERTKLVRKGAKLKRYTIYIAILESVVECYEYIETEASEKFLREAFPLETP